MRYFFLCLIFSSALFANEEGLELIASTNQVTDKQQNYFLTSTAYKINPRVNPITGTYTEESLDLVVAGAQPLSVRRFHYNQAPYDPRYASWSYNPEAHFVANFEWQEQERFAAVGEFDGSVRCLKGKERGYLWGKYRFDQKDQTLGCNFASTGQSHILNLKINYKKIYQAKDKNRFMWSGTILDGTGRKRIFRSLFHRWHHWIYFNETIWSTQGYSKIKHMIGANTWTPYHVQIREEILPNGNRIIYEYKQLKKKSRYPEPEMIRRIVAYNSDKSKQLANLSFHYVRNKKKDVKGIEVTGSDGRLFKAYHKGKKQFYLDNVIADGGIQTYYKYDKGRITDVLRVDGPTLKTYYTDDNKVLAQLAPVGPGRALYAINNYRYHKDYTEVLDALRQKTIYRFDEQKRLTATEFYGKESLLRTENLQWDSTTGNVTSKQIKKGDGSLLQNFEYVYDKNQNCIKETFGDGVVAQTTHRTFSDDGFNLKFTESDRPGREVRYSYVAGTNLLASEFVYADEVICKRTFHSYDDCAICIKTIVDDGTTTNPDDLTGVSYRKITEIEPKQTMPCFGLAEVVREKTIDSAGKEILLSRVVYTYASSGKVLKEEHYDANDQYSHTIVNSYDCRERLLSQTDALGNVTRYDYDNSHNLIAIAGPLPNQYKKIIYDRANRPICTSDLQDDGSWLSCQKEYDLLGQVVAEIDSCGNRTEYKYDVLGNVTAVHFADGGVARRIYDAMGNVIEEVDPLGYTTKKEYDFRGNLTNIVYPDGSQKSYVYNNLGQLISSTSQDGAITDYRYDLFDRPIEVIVTSKEGEVLKRKSASYSAFYKLSESDFNGVETKYQYDFSGRKICESKEERCTEFLYDALGNVAERREFAASILNEYNTLGQLTTKRVIADGLLQRHEEYLYDEAGNQTHLMRVRGTELTYFNTYGKPIIMIDPVGVSTYIRYLHTDRRQEITTYANGVKGCKTFDNRDRIVIEEKRGPEGLTIQKCEHEYDLAGNRLSTKYTVFEGAQPIKTIVHSWSYGPMGRVESFLEAGAKETIYRYDRCGRLAQKIKPDGSVLYHIYNDLGQLVRYYSDDFDYTYCYDKCGQIISVYNAKSHAQTRRTYDGLGQVTREVLETGICQETRYDPQGRCVETVLFDGSTMEYLYDGVNLHKVVRGEQSHTYCKYSFDGDLLEATLPAGLGEIEVKRDALGRCREYRSPYYTASFPEGSFDCMGNLLGYCTDRGQEHQYSYDSLDQLAQEDEQEYQFDSHYDPVKEEAPVPYEYDLCGNLISDGLRCYEYDSLDRLVAVQEGSRRTEYRYDAFNRRLSKETIFEGVSEKTTRYLWDGDDEIGAVDERDQIFELRILAEGLGAEIGAAVLLELQGRSYVPIHDHRGCLIVLVDLDSGQVVQEYTYDAFGQQQGDAPLSPWRFSSKRVDEESGLVFFGRRYYSPVMGRWITQDPEGLDNGRNLYAFVSNCPLTRLDLYGLREWWQCGFQDFGVGVGGRSFNPLLYDDDIRYENISYETNYSNKSQNFNLRDYGRPEIPNGGGISFINGMNNNFGQSFGHALYLSDLSGGYNIHGTYNASHGIFTDIAECYYGLIHGIRTDPCTNLANNWTGFFKEAPEDAILLHMCTSQGAIITRNTLTHFPKDLRERIRVVAIAPGAYISRDLCHSVRHYVTEKWYRDPIPRLDFIGKIKYRDSIHYLPSHPNAEFFDHSFASPTFADTIKMEVDKYLNGNF